MSRTIFKFQLGINDAQTIKMQRGAIIRSVQDQGGILWLWAELDRTAPMEDRIIEIFGTGHLIPDGDRTYLSTVQQGGFVWHVYELHH